MPVCIKELFSSQTAASTEKRPMEPARVKDLFCNLTYLRRVGYCLEVNVESYVAVLSILIDCINNDTDTPAAIYHNGVAAEASASPINI